MAAHTGRHAKMAHDILHSSFPLMDVTVSDYINGKLYTYEVVTVVKAMIKSLVL